MDRALGDGLEMPDDVTSFIGAECRTGGHWPPAPGWPDVAQNVRDFPADRPGRHRGQRAAAVLASAYQPELAARRGVIATRRLDGQLVMIDLAEKPATHAVGAFERRYGTANLLLLEGRTRLTASFIGFAHRYQAPAGTEPKLALTLAAYARTHPVFVTETSAQVIDLGTRPSADRRPAPYSSGTARR